MVISIIIYSIGKSVSIAVDRRSGSRLAMALVHLTIFFNFSPSQPFLKEQLLVLKICIAKVDSNAKKPRDITLSRPCRPFEAIGAILAF